MREIEIMRRQIPGVIPLGDLIRMLVQTFGNCPGHYIKYMLQKIPAVPRKAGVLTQAEFSAYRDFFIKCNPACQNIEWLCDYFSEMIRHHLCCGVFADDMLVSCSDAPVMPYLEDQVQEIGIHTLQAYQGNGYAADVCLCCVAEILKNGKCPQWSTGAENIPSQKLAERIGFRKLADVLTITLG